MTVINGLSRRVVLEPVRRAVRTALALHGVQSGNVTVLVTDSQEMRRLNCAFRGLDSSTDVLSFASPESASDEIGDIAVNIEMASEQAARRGVRKADEAAMLAVHGTLHLLGYDDESEPDRLTMLAKMNAVMRECGLPEEADWSSLPHEGPA